MACSSTESKWVSVNLPAKTSCCCKCPFDCNKARSVQKSVNPIAPPSLPKLSGNPTHALRQRCNGSWSRLGTTTLHNCTPAEPPGPAQQQPCSSARCCNRHRCQVPQPSSKVQYTLAQAWCAEWPGAQVALALDNR